MVVKGMQAGNAKDTGFFFTPLWTMLNFNNLAARVRRKLSEINTPTLILHPRQDDVASLRNAMEIQKKMSGLVELVVLEDSYHMITLDKQRHVVVDRTAGVCPLDREATRSSPDSGCGFHVGGRLADRPAPRPLTAAEPPLKVLLPMLGQQLSGCICGPLDSPVGLLSFYCRI